LPTRKTETLVTYPALVPGPHSRDHLANLLWSNRSEQQARNSLRQALNAIKKLFTDIESQPGPTGDLNTFSEGVVVGGHSRYSKSKILLSKQPTHLTTRRISMQGETIALPNRSAGNYGEQPLTTQLRFSTPKLR
jgi:hypothetical protein